MLPDLVAIMSYDLLRSLPVADGYGIVIVVIELTDVVGPTIEKAGSWCRRLLPTFQSLPCFAALYAFQTITSKIEERFPYCLPIVEIVKLICYQPIFERSFDSCR